MKPTLYADLLAAGIPVANHESDLYFPATPESRAILERHPMQFSFATTFSNRRPPNVGQRWWEVPFAFDPWWEARRTKNL